MAVDSKSKRVFREYAKSMGKEAVEFVELLNGFYDEDVIVTKDSDGAIERTLISYKTLLFWTIQNAKELDL